MLASYLIPFGVLFFRYCYGQDLKQASGLQVWFYVMLGSTFRCYLLFPFALRVVSVRVCNMTMDWIRRGVIDKLVSEPNIV